MNTYICTMYICVYVCGCRMKNSYTQFSQRDNVHMSMKTNKQLNIL